MKAAGLLFIMAAISLSGFIISEKYLSPLKENKRAEELLKNIILGIKRENLALPEIFENILSGCDKETKAFILTFDFRNIDKIDIYTKKSNFCKDETTVTVLKKAFSVLGKYSASEQIAEIENCIDQLKLFYEKNEKDILSKSKLSKSFGILTGLLAVIMLS